MQLGVNRSRPLGIERLGEATLSREFDALDGQPCLAIILACTRSSASSTSSFGEPRAEGRRRSVTRRGRALLGPPERLFARFPYGLFRPAITWLLQTAKRFRPCAASGSSRPAPSARGALGGRAADAPLPLDAAGADPRRTKRADDRQGLRLRGQGRRRRSLVHAKPDVAAVSVDMPPEEAPRRRSRLAVHALPGLPRGRSTDIVPGGSCTCADLFKAMHDRGLAGLDLESLAAARRIVVPGDAMDLRLAPAGDSGARVTATSRSAGRRIRRDGGDRDARGSRRGDRRRDRGRVRASPRSRSSRSARSSCRVDGMFSIDEFNGRFRHRSAAGRGLPHGGRLRLRPAQPCSPESPGDDVLTTGCGSAMCSRWTATLDRNRIAVSRSRSASSVASPATRVR